MVDVRFALQFLEETDGASSRGCFVHVEGLVGQESGVILQVPPVVSPSRTLKIGFQLLDRGEVWSNGVAPRVTDCSNGTRGLGQSRD